MVIVEIINELMSRAGAEVFFVELCKELSKQRQVKLHVIVLYDSIHESFKKEFKKNNINVLSLNKKGRFDIFAGYRLKKILQNIKPDIINTHLNVLTTYFFAFGFFENKWKIVHTVHNIGKKEIDIFNKIIRPIYIKRNLLYFIGISDLITKSIHDIHKKSRIFTVYNGIKINSFCSEEREKIYDFICVARFSEQKNHTLLLDTFEEFNKVFPESNLLCVGGGEDFQKISNYKNTLISKDHIFLMKPVSNIYSLLMQSKFFILTSRFEGNPISILEAMSVGLPIIAPKVGGIPDVVIDEVNGFLFDSYTKEEVLKNMKRIYLEKEEQIKISENNKQRIKKFDIKNISNAYIDVFYKVLDNK